MSLVVAILIMLTVVVVGALVWPKVAHDAVGRLARKRRQTTGLQGQVAEWLYWDAVVSKPDVSRYAPDASPAQPTNPADRALHAVVLRTSLDDRVSLVDAYQRVRDRAVAPLGRAFLSGKMGQATRIHWRSRYRGPDQLFLLWLYAVALVRYGKRHMFLETLSAATKELMQP